MPKKFSTVEQICGIVSTVEHVEDKLWNAASFASRNLGLLDSLSEPDDL